ncbi:MAG: NAD(P)-dependent oxidoreductase [Anaeroplasmataceae bacterium]|nr:NAD(P)-dependent oxidoreductase [Anaeroplasmataceae bacterium]MDE5867710.1 NAD(P)-dependent oxidoreductase [Anaeroplasmataceae bacterium]
MSDIIQEAQRCLKCKRPLCKEGCPVRTEIPTIMQLFLDGKMDEAGKILFENNPLSAVCSLICPHEKNCMGHCVLNHKNSPIKFFEVENYISTFFLDKAKLHPEQKNGHLIGIIGAGPAGLTLAILLAQKGYDVTIIDSKDKIGGVLRYGIPEFRLPKALLDKLLARMNDLGIKFRPNTLIGPTVTIDDMFEDGYDAIFIGTGVWKPNRLRIPGETLGNVHFAIDFLKNPDSYNNLGDHVVIIGAGNVAMDAARTILRKTAAKVDIIFFRGREEVTALEEELMLAEVDGVKMNYYLNTIKIEPDGIIVEPVLKVENEDGSISYKNDSEHPYKMYASSVIIAIGQGAQTNIVKNTKQIDTNQKGLIEASEKGATTRPGVYAAGDVVSGARTVVEAVAATKKVAEEIDQYIKNKYNEA